MFALIYSKTSFLSHFFSSLLSLLEMKHQQGAVKSQKTAKINVKCECHEIYIFRSNLQNSHEVQYHDKMRNDVRTLTKKRRER